MSSKIPIVFGLVFFSFLLIMLFQYSSSMMASTDQGVNVSGTAYNDTYHNSTKQIRATMSFTSYMPYFVGVAGLIGAMFLLFPTRPGSGGKL